MPVESKSLNVLFVAARYFPYMGGMETHVYEVGRRLAHAGVKITILTTDISGKLPIVEKSDGMQIHRVRSWPADKDYYIAPDIYRFISRGHWDLIHCQGYHNMVPPLAMLAALRANIPYMLTFHSAGHSSGIRNALRGLQWEILRPLFSRARKLISVTKFEADFFQERLRLPAEQFVVIPNGAHLPEISTLEEDGINTASDDPLIVSIGRLERYKGHHRLIAALPQVRERIPNARVCILGQGPYEVALREKAQKLGVSEWVDIRAIPPEERRGMASIIRRADLVTLLSDYESQGIAVMEALSLRRPVLVSATSALKELADLGLARIVPLESTPEEVANGVVDQLLHPLIPINIELPTWDDCASKLLALYQDVVWRTTCAS